MEHLIIDTAVRLEVRRLVSICRLVKVGLGFDGAGDLQEVVREEQTGAGTEKVKIYLGRIVSRRRMKRKLKNLLKM